jgi:hypothetical protein
MHIHSDQPISAKTPSPLTDAFPLAHNLVAQQNLLVAKRLKDVIHQIAHPILGRRRRRQAEIFHSPHRFH